MFIDEVRVILWLRLRLLPLLLVLLRRLFVRRSRLLSRPATRQVLLVRRQVAAAVVLPPAGEVGLVSYAL